MGGGDVPPGTEGLSRFERNREGPKRIELRVKVRLQSAAHSIQKTRGSRTKAAPVM